MGLPQGGGLSTQLMPVLCSQECISSDLTAALARDDWLQRLAV